MNDMNDDTPLRVQYTCVFSAPRWCFWVITVAIVADSMVSIINSFIHTYLQ